MLKLNDNFLRLSDSYLFTEINRRTADFQRQNPDKKVIRMGVGDVSLPLTPTVINALHSATQEQADAATFQGYGPEVGYKFLKQAIADNYYALRNIHFDLDEILINDGIASDIANFPEMFSDDAKVLITDPVYPAYLDSNTMAGKEITMLSTTLYPTVSEQINHLKTTGYQPDIIYLCYPNNPTGLALTFAELGQWVEYANKEHAIILFDAAYEAFIQDEDVPHSIFEIEGAKQCAVEFCSFSKSAGFTGLRCGFTVVPKQIADGKLLHNWIRRVCTKYNGAPYIVQRAAEAALSKQGRAEAIENIKYYLQNAIILREGLAEIGLTVKPRQNSPYLWVNVGMPSWDFFDMLLSKYAIVCTPGVGFGKAGEGFVRFSAFANRQLTQEAVERLKNNK
ncbi:MAG: LL-diaminopimelate aminotransferase [Paludibacteraceae bacterium]|nr:LL-diaminopimelate aminotransferase [Paludibacteraceae bacterium]